MRRRAAARASRARVNSFSLTRSSSHDFCHSSAETTGGFFMAAICSLVVLPVALLSGLLSDMGSSLFALARWLFLSFCNRERGIIANRISLFVCRVVSCCEELLQRGRRRHPLRQRQPRSIVRFRCRRGTWLPAFPMEGGGADAFDERCPAFFGTTLVFGKPTHRAVHEAQLRDAILFREAILEVRDGG